MQGEQSVLLLVYAVTVLLAVLTSARAQRTVLFTDGLQPQSFRERGELHIGHLFRKLGSSMHGRQ